jgi:uncharacterized protein YegP (UPF0339 family)
MRIARSLITTLVLSLSTLAATGCAMGGADDGFGEVDGEAAAAGKFDLWQATDGQWHFHLKSGNGRILLTSEAYTSRTAAINGVLSVLDNGVDPAQYELVQAENGYLLHLVAPNHEIISFSQSYATKSSAKRAITSCVNATTSYLDKREAVSAGARVDVAQGETGTFRFNLFASNGQIVLSSEAYASAAAAYNGAFAVQAASQLDSEYRILENADGGFYFTLRANNGEIVGVSQQYTTRQSAAGGIASVKSALKAVTIL